MGPIESILRWTKKKRKIICVSQEEVLNNKLDKKIQDMLRPFHIIMFMCCCPKYSVKNSYITPRGTVFYVQSLFGLAFVFTFTLYKLFEYFHRDNSGGDKVITFACIVNCIYYFIIYTLVTLSSIRISELDVDFVLKINDFYNNFKLVDFNSIVLWNWGGFIGFWLYFVIYKLIFYIYCVDQSNYKLDPADLLYTMFTSSLEIKILYAIFTIKLLRTCMENLKNEAEVWNHNNINDGDEDTEARANKMLKSYMDLKEAYAAYQKSVQGIVLCHISESSIHAMINIGLAIYVRMAMSLIQNVKIGFYIFLTLGGWMLKNLLLQMMLAVECERYYLANEQTAAACAVGIGVNSGINKTVCKQICRLNRSSIPKLSVCRLFHLDADLPFKVINFLATYTIVILQFALL